MNLPSRQAVARRDWVMRNEWTASTPAGRDTLTIFSHLKPLSVELRPVHLPQLL
jgi:hypothetical protein